QVMILFDKQTSEEIVFIVILVRILGKEQKDLHQYVSNMQSGCSCLLERSQIVKYLKKKYPIEANVIKVSMKKNAALLRADMSLNFYLARQKISQILIEAVGEFRDFNGGIILKQREALTSFMKIFPAFSSQNADLIENFFYSISPIEMQAILPISSLKTLFELFLEAMSFNISIPSDSFFKHLRQGEKLFIMVRTPDSHFKEQVDQILITEKVALDRIVTSSTHLQNTYFLGYLLEVAEAETQEQLVQAVARALQDWKNRIESRQILRLGMEYSIVSLDPRIGGDNMSSLVLRMLFEGLMRENREGKIEHGIAKTVEISQDCKSYLFGLREALWSDGTFVSAFDFEYAWKKILSPDFRTPFAYLFYPIKNAQAAKEGKVPIDNVGIHALDDLTLKVELKSPTSYFLELTAHTIYSPVHRFKDQLHPNWPMEEGDAYVCNGAFQLEKNHFNEKSQLEKNPLYWDRDNIKLDQIVVLKAHHLQAYEMFQKSNSDWIGPPLTAWDPSFLPGEKDECVDFRNKSIYWYVFNCQKPPFNNKKMRQAFALAVNREELAAVFDVASATTPLPAWHSLIERSALPKFNPERAKALFREALEEMQISLKDLPVFSISHLIGSLRHKMAEMIKHDWEDAFGICCSVDPLAWDVLFSKIIEGNFQIGCITWHPWVNDPMYTLDSFRYAKEPINFPKWEHPRYKEILCLVERETNLQKRQSYYLQAEEFLIDEMPVIPLFSSPAQALKKKKLCIHRYSCNLINFKWAYFSST
ncbi:MAG: peptide ABC transporter substrate-binding protein, partial [Anaerolineae bacterium]